MRKPVVKPGTPSAEVDAAAPGKKKKGKDKGPQPLRTYPKVEDKYRRALTATDFAADGSGDINRDPFRSYLVEEQAATSGGTKKPKGGDEDVDLCKKRMVAEQYGIRDLRLVGIVKQGTTAYALFIDSQNFGHIARRDDCLSKDKVRIKEIGAQTITVEIRGEPPPGQKAPEPREEEWKLHPDSQLIDQQLGGGEQ